MVAEKVGPLLSYRFSNIHIFNFPGFTDQCTVVGTLKGFDQLMNLVLDDVKESMRGKCLWYLFHSFSALILTACT